MDGKNSWLKIRVNSISPGGIKRKQSKDLLDNTKKVPLEGWLRGMMYKFCNFLASGMSNYITGKIL